MSGTGTQSRCQCLCMCVRALVHADCTATHSTPASNRARTQGDVDFELLSPFGLGPDHRTPGDQASGASSPQSVSALLQSEFPNDPDEVSRSTRDGMICAVQSTRPLRCTPNARASILPQSVRVTGHCADSWTGAKLCVPRTMPPHASVDGGGTQVRGVHTSLRCLCCIAVMLACQTASIVTSCLQLHAR